MGDKLITDNLSLAILLLVFVLLLIVVVIMFFIRRLSNPVVVQEHSKQEEPREIQAPLEGQFVKQLMKAYLLLENRLVAWNRAAKTYKPGTGTEFDFHALEQALKSSMLFDVQDLVKQYHSLFANPKAPRIAALLMHINHDFVSLGTRTNIMGQNFKNQYEYATQLFGFYVFQLTQLNDQLEQHVKDKRLKPDLQYFASIYLEIFQDWTSSGVDKSIQELQCDLVLRIKSLNEQFPQSPLYKQIAEYTSKCEHAYDITEGLDRKVKALVQDGRTAMISAMRIIRCLSGSQPFQAPSWQSSIPPSSLTPQPIPTTGTTGTKPVNFSDWAKNIQGQPLTGYEHLLHKTASAPKEDTPVANTEQRQSFFKAHRYTWIAIFTTLCLSLIGGFCWISYQGQGLNSKRQYAGVSHLPVDSTERIHSFDRHFSLLKPQLDSAHLMSKVDSLRNLWTVNDLDSKEVNAIIRHIDSLKAEPQLADAPSLLYGIDVSAYQGSIDWNGVIKDKSGPNPIHFAIMRATLGLETDEEFKKNWSSSKELIPIVGAYHFLSFSHDPIKQAKLFIQTVPLEPGNMRPIIDVETNCKTCNPTMGLTKVELIQHIQAYLQVIEAHYNTKAIIYSNVQYYNTYLKGKFPEHDFWLAEYRGAQGIKKVIQSHQDPPDQEIPVMWQFSSTGKIMGINPKHNVDLSFLEGTYRERIKIN
jgi:lysozyme